MIITIDDTGATTLSGSKPGDQTTIRQLNRAWRWSPAKHCWVLPRTLTKTTRDSTITETIAAFESEGRTITVEGNIDTDPGSPEATRARLSESEAFWTERAATLYRKADAAWKKTTDLRALIPLGQPILTGHHSEKKDRNFRAKLHKRESQAITWHREAEQAQRRAASCRAKLNALDSEECRPDHVQVGDMVFHYGWHRVLRVNRKSVSTSHSIERLAEAGRTETHPFTKITAIARDGQIIWKGTQNAR